MTLIRTLFLASLLLVSAGVTFAQTEQGSKAVASADPAVTVSISDKGVRFAALGSVGQMRLEVFNAAGDSLYSSDFQAGNVRDWGLADKKGQALPDGSYMCVVTVRDLAGKLSLKQGIVVVQAGQAALKFGDGDQTGAVEPDKALTPVVDGKAAAVSLMAHNGLDGRVVSTRGSLTFQLGDFFAGTDKEMMRLTPAGNVGIGIAHPAVRLDVDGLIRASRGIVFPDGSVQVSAARRTIGAPSLTVDQAGRIQSAGQLQSAGQEHFGIQTAGTGTQNKIAKWIDNAGTLGDSALTDTGFIAIDSTNNPLIGGSGTLLIQGGANKERVELQSAGIIPGPAVQGRGFGGSIAAPTATVANTDLFIIGGSGYNGSGIVSVNAGTIKIKSEQNWTTSANGAYMTFETTQSGSTTAARLERMRITGDGKVGIGTTTPAVKLDVAGDLQVTGNAVITGNIAAKYQDVAEWVPSRQKLAAGTVVILDVTHSNVVAPSARAYDTHVAGVVSSKPGVILGERGEGKVMVATTGRVRVKVDATRHPIRIGDLLVTSGKTGAAMKSQPIRVAGALIHRPGTIIGKALEPLASGEGEILVLLSLQ